MEKQSIINAIKELKEKSQKRNFNQTYDLIITLKDMDLKKTENHVDFFQELHYPKGKKAKICALIGPEMENNAKGAVDKYILVDDFPRFAKDKTETKKLAKQFDYFIAQATIMPKVATTFGKIFGPKGKMPNPKAGCVVPPNAALKPLYEKLQKTIRLTAKTSLMVQTAVGKEDMPDEQIIDNIQTVHDALMHHLPNAEHNIKNILLKFTMGKPVLIKK
ncbi:50S ribosomal protein L1 [Candidatus Woesearchaeota archaeon]|nr:50S ribosomal protein L1 [Candidatus Woesearchaeota archaeon]